MVAVFGSDKNFLIHSKLEVSSKAVSNMGEVADLSPCNMVETVFFKYSTNTATSIMDSELVVFSSNDDKVLAVPLSSDSVIFPVTQTV